MTSSDRSDRRVVYQGQHLHFYRVASGWEYVRRSHATSGVTIVALTDSHRLVLIEQHRVPLDRHVIELPAGLVGDTGDLGAEDVVAAVRRELEEETGYECAEVTFLCRGSTSPGLADEINHVYLAQRLRRVDSTRGDVHHEDGSITHATARGIPEEGEQILVHEVPLDSVTPWLERQRDDGKIIDLRVYVGLFFARELSP